MSTPKTDLELAGLYEDLADFFEQIGEFNDEARNFVQVRTKALAETTAKVRTLNVVPIREAAPAAKRAKAS